MTPSLRCRSSPDWATFQSGRADASSNRPSIVSFLSQSGKGGGAQGGRVFRPPNPIDTEVRCGRRTERRSEYFESELTPKPATEFERTRILERMNEGRGATSKKGGHIGGNASYGYGYWQSDAPGRGLRGTEDCGIDPRVAHIGRFPFLRLTSNWMRSNVASDEIASRASRLLIYLQVRAHGCVVLRRRKYFPSFSRGGLSLLL